MGRRPGDVYPLEQLPQDMQERIAWQVAQPLPPERWLRLVGGQIESRGWWEWHWQRGLKLGNTRQSLPAALRLAVIARDGLLCGICAGDVAADDVHIDHIKPVSRGGTDHMDNLQVTHSLCNIKKGARY